MQQTGYLLLADISGYTEFVTHTEVDHGAEILHDLMEVLVARIRAPLRVQEIEGDAIFAWAPTHRFEHGILLVETIEELYASLRTAIDDIRRNSTCSCRACARAAGLDLKFVVHHGSFVERSIAGHQGIGGTDVILAHRLLKNRIRENTGCGAYAFFTNQAVESLGIGELTAGMTRHEEAYAHLGRVAGWVYDMAAWWDRTQEARRIRVAREGAYLGFEAVLPVSLTVAWDCVTNPRHRQKWLDAERLTVESRRNGRYAAGTVEHCVHGKESTPIRTLDWKPMRYVTHAIVLPLGGEIRQTISLEECDGSTRVSIAYGAAHHEKPALRPLFRLLMVLAGPSLRKDLTSCADRLFGLIRAHAGEPVTAAGPVD